MRWSRFTLPNSPNLVRISPSVCHVHQTVKHRILRLVEIRLILISRFVWILSAMFSSSYLFVGLCIPRDVVQSEMSLLLAVLVSTKEHTSSKTLLTAFFKRSSVVAVANLVHIRHICVLLLGKWRVCHFKWHVWSYLLPYLLQEWLQSMLSHELLDFSWLYIGICPRLGHPPHYN